MGRVKFSKLLMNNLIVFENVFLFLSIVAAISSSGLIKKYMETCINGSGTNFQNCIQII